MRTAVARLERWLLNARIVRWQFKLLFIVGAYLVGFVVIRGVLASGASQPIVDTLDTAIDFTAVFYGSRIFRGRDELREPDRPLWQFTARPTASRRLGALFATLFGFSVVVLILMIVAQILVASGVLLRRLSADWWSIGISLVEFFTLAALYRNSAKRLTTNLAG